MREGGDRFWIDSRKSGWRLEHDRKMVDGIFGEVDWRPGKGVSSYSEEDWRKIGGGLEEDWRPGKGVSSYSEFFFSTECDRFFAKMV